MVGLWLGCGWVRLGWVGVSLGWVGVRLGWVGVWIGNKVRFRVRIWIRIMIRVRVRFGSRDPRCIMGVRVKSYSPIHNLVNELTVKNISKNKSNNKRGQNLVTNKTKVDIVSSIVNGELRWHSL
jgi:hypothetical protein